MTFFCSGKPRVVLFLIASSFLTTGFVPALPAWLRTSSAVIGLVGTLIILRTGRSVPKQSILTTSNQYRSQNGRLKDLSETRYKWLKRLAWAYLDRLSEYVNRKHAPARGCRTMCILCFAGAIVVLFYGNSGYVLCSCPLAFLGSYAGLRGKW